MPDVTQIERANARLIEDPGLTYRIVAAVRELSGHVRRDHPRGYAAIDIELAAGLRHAGERKGGEQLLAMESLQSRFHDLEKEAKAELERLRKLKFEDGLERQRERMTGGFRRPARAPAVRDADRLMRQRLDMVLPALSGAMTDDDFAARLDDVESAVTSFRNAIGIERREHRITVAAKAADKAVAERIGAAG